MTEPELTVEARARRVRLLLLDVDGVLTDGTFVPKGDAETKRFHARDGIGIVLARRGGLKVGLISGRGSSLVESRARELRMDFVRLGESDKLRALEQALEQESCSVEEVAYMGDDLPDLPILMRAGLAATVGEAPATVRSRVHYVSEARGGYGAVRELIELILASQGKLEALIESFAR